MKGWSIFAGRLFGVELRIHTTFLLLLLFVLVTESTYYGGAGTPRGIALVGIIFGSVILHELGHAVVAAGNGVRVRGILLLPIGGLALMDPQEHVDTAKDPVRDLVFLRFGKTLVPVQIRVARPFRQHLRHPEQSLRIVGIKAENFARHIHHLLGIVDLLISVHRRLVQHRTQFAVRKLARKIVCRFLQSRSHKVT